jgi:hypothetical protein
MYDHFGVTSDWLGELLAPGRFSKRVQHSSIHSGFLATESLQMISSTPFGLPVFAQHFTRCTLDNSCQSGHYTF